MTKTAESKHHVRKIKSASTTNKRNQSLVKIVIQSDNGEWAQPTTGKTFYIDENSNFPFIAFEIKTDRAPPYQWKWEITWDAHVSGLRENTKRGKKLRAFSHTGTFGSNSRLWEANLDNMTLGGKLSVEVTVGELNFRRTVFILGKNPAKADVITFVSSLPDTIGFDKIIEQESHFKNFIERDNEPVVAGDAGFGLTQMTNPKPTYEQVWNWKENVKAGVKLFQEKQEKAKVLLKAHPYTADQLARETLALWNGSKYHEPNTQIDGWQRKSILCDQATSNIGWDVSDPANADKTVEELHERDKDTYNKMQAGRDKTHVWIYSGVCYADHVIGK